MQAPERLEFTFRWDGDNHEDAAGIEMYVIVVLERLSNGGTRMHFSQSGPFSFASGENHRAGWDSTFTRLRHDLFEDELDRSSAAGAINALGLVVRTFTGTGDPT